MWTASWIKFNIRICHVDFEKQRHLFSGRVESPWKRELISPSFQECQQAPRFKPSGTAACPNNENIVIFVNLLTQVIGIPCYLSDSCFKMNFLGQRQRKLIKFML